VADVYTAVGIGQGGGDGSAFKVLLFHSVSFIHLSAKLRIKSETQKTRGEKSIS
jgi:hypothetical protein